MLDVKGVLDQLVCEPYRQTFYKVLRSLKADSDLVWLISDGRYCIMGKRVFKWVGLAVKGL